MTEKIEKKDGEIRTGKMYPYLQTIPDIMSYQIVSGALLTGLLFVLKKIFRLLLKSAGKAALTSSDLLFLFTSWQGLLMIAVGLATIIVYIVFELNGLISMTDRMMKNEDRIVLASIKDAVRGIRRLFSPSGLLVLLFIAIVVPLIGIGVSISATKTFYIPTFISSVIRDTPLYNALYIIAITVCTVIAFIYSLTLHGVMLDELDAGTAMKQSRTLIMENWKNYLWQLFQFFLTQALTVVLLMAIIAVPVFYTAFTKTPETFEHYPIILAALFWTVAMAMFTTLLEPFYIMKLTRIYRQYEAGAEVRYPIRKRKVHILLGLYMLGGLVCIFLVAHLLSDNFDHFFPTEVKPYTVAHRGAGNEAPENTVKGVLTAYELGAYGSEIDVQRTADGYYIVNHDGTFERTAGNPGKPEEMTLKQIRKLNVEGEPVAMIEEMLEASHRRIVLFIELKGNTADTQMADDLVRMIRERKMEEETVLISLKYDLIDYIEDNYSDIQTAYLTFVSFGDISQLNCDYIGLEEESATYSNIDLIHESGKKVLVWTVNEEKSQRHFLKTSVDGIITDNITQANEIREELENRSDLQRILDSFFSD